jgi:cobalt/nickel transport system permease protein
VASRWTDPRACRALLLGWLAAVFAISALTDLRALAAAAVGALVVFHRGLVRNVRRAARSVVPISVGLSAVSWLFLWGVQRNRPDVEPFVALALRTTVIAFLTFAVLDRANLFRALEPWPTPTRLLVVTLAQIHALRLLVTDSLQGLRSRLVRKPGPQDVLRSAGGVTAAMFTLSSRNAREIADAMRSRGF